MPARKPRLASFLPAFRVKTMVGFGACRTLGSREIRGPGAPRLGINFTNDALAPRLNCRIHDAPEDPHDSPIWPLYWSPGLCSGTHRVYRGDGPRVAHLGPSASPTASCFGPAGLDRCGVLLRLPRPVWAVDLDGAGRLGTGSRVGRSLLETLYGWTMGLDRLRLDMGFRRAVGLGRLPLWALDPRAATRVGLDPGGCLGPGVGGMAAGPGGRRMGPSAPASRIHGLRGTR